MHFCYLAPLQVSRKYGKTLMIFAKKFAKTVARCLRNFQRKGNVWASREIIIAKRKIHEPRAIMSVIRTSLCILSFSKLPCWMLCLCLQYVL